jgi:hypothetical protein
MLFKAPDPLSLEIAAEARMGVAMAGPMRRVAGLCTLVMAGLWALGCYNGSLEIYRSLALANISRLMQQNMAVHPPVPEFDFDIVTVDDAQMALQQREAAIAEWRLDLKAQRKLMVKQTIREQKVQASVTIGWTLFMGAAGLVLLIAALCGLAGSMRTRKWHRRAAWWVVVSTAATAAGIFALVKWGGLPPLTNHAYLAEILSKQIAYAVAIVVTLLLSRRSAALELVTKIS